MCVLEEITTIGRLTHLHPALGEEEGYGDERYAKLSPVPVAEANVVSSLLTNGKHAPAIDLDVPAHLVPSRTPGHHHLYIDAELTWNDYLRLLRVMSKVGLIEPGYTKSAEVKGHSLLRVPR